MLVATLVVLYLAAIIAANLSSARFGPSASIVNAFAFIGLDLTTRDRLHDFWQRRRLPKMIALILAGSLLSFVASHVFAGSAPPAVVAKIAEASAIAFAAAELADYGVYSLVKDREWLYRSNVSNIASSAIDSLVFVTIAFGFSWQIIFAQFCAKGMGGFCWSLVIGKVRARREAKAAV